MKRIPEPELMNDPEQALAYANADFEQPHSLFIDLFKQRFPGLAINGNVLDLGCGPADISIRFALAYPSSHIDGVDGAEQMLHLGRKAINKQALSSRIDLKQGTLPEFTITQYKFDVIISNSLLHHLADPDVLWESIQKHAQAGTVIFIMDLMRPDSREQAQALVQEYAENEAEILRSDFYNSLLAAYRIEEVNQQLHKSKLDFLAVEAVSDRHLIIYGQMPK